MVTKIALLGAGGKMGTRITNNMKGNSDYEIAYVEISPTGIENLRSLGLSTTPQDEALAHADAVILALPDKLIGKISHNVVPKMKSGAMLIGLDPAAAYAGVIMMRNDLSYFITHPCHPPLFNDDVDPDAMHDWFGGIYAAQHIVCALHQGADSDYAKGEAIARIMYAPIVQAHRITVEQMAILEPALVETFAATLITMMHEGFQEVVKMGVPEPAARAFLMGHIRIELAIIFGFAGFPFSDGAKLAIENAKSRIFLPDWKQNVFNMENIRKSVAEITGTEEEPIR